MKLNLRSIGVSSAILLIAALRAAAQTGGVAPEWEVRKNLGALAANIQRIKPILEQARPKEWVAKGASEAYVGQWQTIRKEIDYLGISIQTLVRQPGKLTAALDAFFRIDRLQSLLNSLGAGIRRYQNSALADLLESVVSEGAANREGLRQYVLDLAAEKEREFAVADQEAQRCRAILSRQPAGAKKTEGSKQERR